MTAWWSNRTDSHENWPCSITITLNNASADESILSFRIDKTVSSSSPPKKKISTEIHPSNTLYIG